MKHWVGTASVFLLLGSLRLGAQTSLEVLESDLKEAKTQHDTASSQETSSFLDALQTAGQSPNDALALYQKAGGALPDSSPVVTDYSYETPTERQARQTRDAARLNALGGALQLQCGLMRQAALLATTPNAQGVQADWIKWLKEVPPLYEQITDVPEAPPTDDSNKGSTTPRHHHHNLNGNDSADNGEGAGTPPAPTGGPLSALLSKIKQQTMKDSPISAYLGFHGWGKTEQGGWSFSQLPDLYHQVILDPLRHPPVAGVVDTWNNYIGMRQTDETDPNKWTQEEEPELDFDRDSDDFAVQPTMDKLAALDAIIKANPSDSHLDDWISRMEGMLAAYRNRTAAPASSTPLLPGETPGTPSSEAAGVTPTASPGTPSSSAAGPIPSQSYSLPTAGSAGTLPTASPGTPDSEAAGPIPAASPGTPSSAAGGATPAPTAGGQ